MITEDYVSFEMANLLKEKGFDTICNGYYNQEKTLQKCSLCSIEDTLKSPFYFDCIPAPTIQMAMKWLREVHKIIPVVLTGGDSQNPFYYWFRIDTAKEDKWKDAIYREDEKEFSTYEEACEAAIKYCLENLVNDEQKPINSTLEEKSRIDDAFTKMMLKKPTE